MKVLWLDRDGYTEKTEIMTPRQARIKVGPLLDPKGTTSNTALRPSRHCATVSIEDGTLTVYSRGGSWCRDHKEQCRGNGCSQE